MLVEALLSHYYRPEAGEHDEIVAADWITALSGRHVAHLAEARRRWLTSRQRRPTIAEFLEFVRIVEDESARTYNPAEGRILLPEQPGVSYAQLSEPDRWSWHARVRAFRKQQILLGPNQCDPNGKYNDAGLDRQAEAELAAKRRPVKPREMTAREQEAHECRLAFAKARGFSDFGALKQEIVERVKEAVG